MSASQREFQRHDVVVVGAGPGGAMAAAEAASLGLTTLLLDMSDFPRDKTCGDGLPGSVGRFVQTMKVEFQERVVRPYTIDGVSIQGPSGIVREHVSAQGSAAFTSRRIDFDYFLFQCALSEGAAFEKAKINQLVRDGQGHISGVLDSNGTYYPAGVVIAADGATSTLARALFGRRDLPYERAIAARAYADLKTELPRVIYLKYLPDLVPGYAWLFPLTDQQANIGIGVFDRKAYKRLGIGIRELVERFVRDYRREFPMEVDYNTFQTWQIPCWTPSRPWEARGKRIIDGVCLVGDAGGNVDFLTGGGIKYAMQTGILAAQRAHKLLRDGYSQQEADAWFWAGYKRDVRRDLQITYAAQQFIGKHPWVMNTLLKLVPKGKEGAVLNKLIGGHG
jgi:geranylgeranyl reductase family protein